MERQMERQKGATLIDAVVVMAIAGLTLAVSLPYLQEARRRAGLETLARRLAAATHRCRLLAIDRRHNVGLVFAEAVDGWRYVAAEDGDGDGVSRRDVANGVDPGLGPEVRFESLCQGARLGIPEGWEVPDPSGRGLLRPGDGLKAGSSDVVSFTALGNATPCSVYINDARDRMLALRIYGATARVRVLEWRRGWPRWRQKPL